MFNPFSFLKRRKVERERAEQERRTEELEEIIGRVERRRRAREIIERERMRIRRARRADSGTDQMAQVQASGCDGTGFVMGVATGVPIPPTPSAFAGAMIHHVLVSDTSVDAAPSSRSCDASSSHDSVSSSTSPSICDSGSSSSSSSDW